MGSGKTTIANMLAKKLNLEVIEMDQLILKKSGRNSISEIFSLDGEKHFRMIEKQVCLDLKDKDSLIISTGGGVIVNEINMVNLKNNGKVIYLKASFTTVSKRLKNFKNRPLFKDLKEAKKLFDLREKLYKKFADIIIITDDKNIDEIVSCLLNLL